jgi:uncharacterized protein YndB with AHSA1/START domain
MDKGLVAEATKLVDAQADEVWTALTDPRQIREYMFGADVDSDFRVGSTITWRGEINGKKYEDHGRILEVAPGRLLKYTHFSPLAGKPDVPENYHTVAIALDGEDGGTRVTLRQDGNADRAAQRHSETNWAKMLDGLKTVVERTH